MKTDARDALHIAKLLRLDEIVAITIPSETQEAARDLVRAREDARRDLMSARHRLGKLLHHCHVVNIDGRSFRLKTMEAQVNSR